MVERTDLNAQMSVEDATLERSAEEIRHDIAVAGVASLPS
jgi:hypothetical protein